MTKLKPKIYVFFATFFGIGYLLPKAQGTLASFLTLPLAYLLYNITHNFFKDNKVLSTGFILLIIALLILFSWLVIDKTEEFFYEHDSSKIIIDEVCGQLITLFLVPPGWIAYLLGFLLFRFFDILKPGPIGWVDKNMLNSLGVLMDDLIAGIFANMILLGIYILFY